ncbi:MAG: hypothetical protein K0S37_1148, partial [Microbacterium sp.]|nr:hypothetical protein [Microbacterium sp.]
EERKVQAYAGGLAVSSPILDAFADLRYNRVRPSRIPLSTAAPLPG